MTTQKQHKTKSIQSQKGAVAIIVALGLVAMIGILGLVLDLGHLYVAKTELQNAADAAALSGAKQLDGSSEGVCCGDGSGGTKLSAVYIARHVASLNKFNLNTTPVVITTDDLEFSSSPDGPWVSVAEAQAAPSDKTFLKVHTGFRDLNTWFIQVMPGVASTMQTFGMAVAGKYVVNITPLAVCAISLTKTATNSTTNELLEFGFRRGIAYNIPDLNPLGASGVPMWVNPVDAFPGYCDPSHSSAAFTAPFVCVGNTASITALPQKIYVSTGTSASLEKALNSRFDRFTGSSCDPTSAPPDTNIKEFTANAGNPNPAGCANSAAASSGCGFPRDWMDTLNTTTPVQQTISLAPGASGRLVPLAAPTFLQYGALWTFNRALNGASTPFNASNSDWGTLYNSGVTLQSLINTTAGGYPDPTDTTMSPYAKGNQLGSSNKYFEAPSASHPGKVNRRVLNVAILNCDSLAGAGLSCSQIDVIGIGKFFMQVPAEFGGSPKKVQGEFSGLISQLPPADIRLYR